MAGTVSEALLYGKSLLKKHGIESYSIDAGILMAHVMKFSRGELLARGEFIVDDRRFDEYGKLLTLRLGKMPVAYITNSCEFMSLPFYIDENVLIPRNDTEILVEKTIEIARKNSCTLGLEIGVGSGCVSTSMAKYCERLNMVGADISKKALEIAVRNARANNVEGKIAFCQSDLFDGLPEQINGKLDFIISNPPYIRSAVIETLDSGVKDFEPREALDGGADGLDFYRKIAGGAGQYLIAGGYLLFEIGYDQAGGVYNIMERNGFSDINVLRDLAGLDRVVYGRKGEICNNE